MQVPTAPGTLIQNRYRLVGAAGEGQFGQTYLARDLARFNELCVLKEFIPVQTDPVALEALKQQFNQRASALFAVEHPQLPHLRPMIAQEQRLYWVREYIEGKSYGVLLDDRKANGQTFSELKVMELLVQVLPVLSYLHERGVVHRNLSPDTIILRQKDQLPVLISIGLVFDLVARLQLHPVSPMAIPKGFRYAPPEQRQTGRIYSNCDLYALGMTAVVLLSGKEPEDLYDDRSQICRWEHQVRVHPKFARVLRQMLQPNPQKRFSSAKQVMQVLEPLLEAALRSRSSPAEQSQSTSERQAQPVSHPQPASHTPDAPATEAISITPVQPATKPRKPKKRRTIKLPISRDTLASIALFLGLGLLGASVAWRILFSVRPERVPSSSPSPTIANVPKSEVSLPPPSSNPNSASSPSPSPEFSDRPQVSSEALRDRLLQLGINFDFFSSLVDEAFYAQYPQLQNLRLDSTVEQAQFQTEWNKIASSLMDKLETLTPATRQKLGTYRRASYDQWLVELGEANVASSPTLDPLADERFFQLFPELKGKTLNPQTFGQIWYAIAEEQLSTAKSKQSTSPQ
jgi:serine/threonine-protein kinase